METDVAVDTHSEHGPYTFNIKLINHCEMLLRGVRTLSISIYILIVCFYVVLKQIITLTLFKAKTRPSL